MKTPKAKNKFQIPRAPAPREESIPCPMGANCCGQPMVRYPYREQLKRKQKKVTDALRDAGFSAETIRCVQETRSSPLTLGYRNKAKWILKPDAKTGLKMGMYRRGTHDVVDISDCIVHAPAINEISKFIKRELIRNKVPCGSEDLTVPTLRYLIVRYSFREKKLLTVFITTASRVPGLEAVFKSLEATYAEKVTAIVQNINDDSGDVLLGEANRFFKKSKELSETLGTVRVPVGPLSFLQVNSSQASYLYQRVRKLLGSGPFATGLDLYSGVGLMAMHMASATKKILAVEEMGSAALEGITAVRQNKIHNILQLCADSLEGISTFFNEWGSPDWIILNPPRKGCDEKVLRAILTKPPGKIAYVSCSPQTLARDLKILIDECPDLVLKTIEPVDMFPQTEHVECIALLENQNYSNSTQKASRGGRGKNSNRPEKAKSLH